MADNNKLELVVDVDVNKANTSIKSINTGRPTWSRRRVCRHRRLTVSIVKGPAAGIGNSLKTALLTAIKDVVTSRVAAMLMNMFVPGANVQMQQGGIDGGKGRGGGLFGGLCGILWDRCSPGVRKRCAWWYAAVRPREQWRRWDGDDLAAYLRIGR